MSRNFAQAFALKVHVALDPSNLRPEHVHQKLGTLRSNEGRFGRAIEVLPNLRAGVSTPATNELQMWTSVCMTTLWVFTTRDRLGAARTQKHLRIAKAWKERTAKHDQVANAASSRVLLVNLTTKRPVRAVKQVVILEAITLCLYRGRKRVVTCPLVGRDEPESPGRERHSIFYVLHHLHVHNKGTSTTTAHHQHSLLPINCAPHPTRLASRRGNSRTFASPYASTRHRTTVSTTLAMAEEVSASVPVDATKTVEETARSEEAVAEPAVAEPKPAEGGVVATSGVTEVPATEVTPEEPATKEGGTADAQADAPGDDADAAAADDAPPSNGTPAPKKATNGKRKSGAGVPEHKKKTPAKGKKSAPKLRLDVSAGDMFMVAMRGYQPWPVIVCDESMLPESLLSKRPVSAKRIDGTYRDDFLEGGKNAKDRRYPIMFLGTNEFAWQVNTELLDFDIEDVKKDVLSGKQGKKNKALWEAYQVAAEGHDLEYFKQLLDAHESALQEETAKLEEKEQLKKEKAEKATKRKSTAAAGSEDVDMEDAGDDATSSTKKKATKKRKKTDESDGEVESEKPAKTPKTKLKLTAKTPKEASAAKPKKEPKSKKKSSEEAEPAVPEEPPMTEEERLQKREKQVLYLRHRLQKGFLSRDQAPKNDDMFNMSDYLTQLEALDDLQAEVIKKTKVNKVLKAILKLETIPLEEEYNFKKRSNDLLGKWNNVLASENEQTSATGAPSAELATNGANGDDEKKTESVQDEQMAEKTEDENKKDETPGADTASAKAADIDGDVAMSEADKEVIKDAPAAKAEAESTNAAEPESAAADTEMSTA
ncbi:hypothetical protein NX059_003988 [Plenodomus lindquistii]|nr:hypothetical protein NX059_003988 [Plenodomus lindquistii]